MPWSTFHGSHLRQQPHPTYAPQPSKTGPLPPIPQAFLITANTMEINFGHAKWNAQQHQTSSAAALAQPSPSTSSPSEDPTSQHMAACSAAILSAMCCVSF